MKRKRIVDALRVAESEAKSTLDSLPYAGTDGYERGYWTARLHTVRVAIELLVMED